MNPFTHTALCIANLYCIRDLEYTFDKVLIIGVLLRF